MVSVLSLVTVLSVVLKSECFRSAPGPSWISLLVYLHCEEVHLHVNANRAQSRWLRGPIVDLTLLDLPGKVLIVVDAVSRAVRLMAILQV